LSEHRTNLTGIWHGLYSYPKYLDPVYFVATIISYGSSFSGTNHEAAEGWANAPLELFASLDGSVAAAVVSFTKQYDGTGGWVHAVSYAGDLRDDDNEISGRWQVSGAWSGPFMMLRGTGVTETTARKAFAKV
jgi:hypothetical protein